MDDQRDYAEEAYNQAEMQGEDRDVDVIYEALYGAGLVTSCPTTEQYGQPLNLESGDVQDIAEQVAAAIRDRSKFLIWSNQRGMWWRPNERGYTQILEEAGVYSRADAERIISGATIDGQLVYDRTDPISGRRYQCCDEVAVPAWQWPGRLSGFAKEEAGR